MQEAVNQTTLANSKQKEGFKLNQIVTFKVANQECGVDIMKVQEIILPGEITQVPEVPDYIKGVINLRGNVIPIIDLRKRFNMPEVQKDEDTRIIVVNVNSKTMGVVVDAVSEVLRVNVNEIEPPPPTISGLGKDYLKGLIKLEKRLLILLDLDKILSIGEAHQVNQASEEITIQ